MTSFNDYWKKKAAKRKKGWAAKNERFVTDHTILEQIRSKVFQPIDYDKRGFDANAFVFIRLWSLNCTYPLQNYKLIL